MRKWVILAICLWGAQAAAQQVEEVEGYYSGQKYRALPDAGRNGYVAGAFDGINRDFPWFAKCTPGWSLGQLVAVFDKHLTDHPEKWHLSAASVLPFAIGSVCASAPAFYRR